MSNRNNNYKYPKEEKDDKDNNNNNKKKRKKWNKRKFNERTKIKNIMTSMKSIIIMILIKIMKRNEALKQNLTKTII